MNSKPVNLPCLVFRKENDILEFRNGEKKLQITEKKIKWKQKHTNENEIKSNKNDKQICFIQYSRKDFSKMFLRYLKI